MTWFKIDDRAAFNAKVLKAKNELIAEQRAEMAGQNDEATGLHPDGFQRPEGGG